MTIPDIKDRWLTISEVRDHLRVFAYKLEDLALRDELLALIPHLYRRPARYRNLKVSRPMSPELKHEIAVFALENPTWSLRQIAAKFNVNSGRVSEITTGYRN
jgi:hypothetical protein